MSACLALLIASVVTAPTIGDGPPSDGYSILLTDRGAFEVVGIDPGALDRLGPEALADESIFSVAVQGADVPMLGSLAIEGDRLRFDPRFPVRPGTTYRATFRPASLPDGDPDAGPITADLTPPRPSGDDDGPARVVAAFPSADIVPENLLRIYLHFSRPMSRGEAYRRVSLERADGETVDLPFLELDEELWDPSGTRLTLLIDPGRIKQGLVPREELGPVLEAGRSYVLRIDPEWPDAEGRPLASGFARRFEAGPPVETPPDPSSWEIGPPSPGSRDPLVVRFPAPLDHALLGRLLSVVDAGGTRIHGSPEVDEHETRWRFTPVAPWSPGAYRLIADSDLEDLAGNGIGRPFEVDVFDRVEPRVEARPVALPFRIGP
jgi:hypothetical protein